ncbi:unnamed protein product [Euphydryas editha]|uniref:Reverse transcriptase domain-containing protein n=1 Tax=Euphydryas editha TaxID=104508 RepID=A0AAU9UDV2_EUPED|nr:unnamed protein product [Euphydryas editha]
MSINNLYQFNSVGNCDGRQLDLVLSNFSNVKVSKAPDLLSALDAYHPNLLIAVEHSHSSYLRSNRRSHYSYFKADYSAIVREIRSLNWVQLLNDSHSVDTMVQIFYSHLYKIIETLVPKRKSKLAKYPVWFSQGLIRLISEKEKYRRKFSKYHNPRDNLEFKITRKRCHKLYDICFKEYRRKTELNIRKDPKQFWSYFKNLKGRDSSLPASMRLDDTMADSGSSIANLFAQHFSSIFTQTTHVVNNNIKRSTNLQQLPKFRFLEVEVLRKIKGLNIHKGMGPDNIPPIFVKRCGVAIALPLTMIFNRSLQEGIFPNVWKKARIVPVFKKDDRTDIKNYRPISILSCFSKLFESLVHSILARHFENLLDNSQHGFRGGLSVQTNLSNFITDLMVEVDKGNEIDAIYTDFSSAFDKVDHIILLNKLSQCGIGPCLLKWIESYLHQRPQTVVVNGFESAEYIARSGVPQGSHLGPLLFLAFINDITTVIRHSKCSLYADDLKIYRTVGSNVDVQLLQADLDVIVNY